MNSCVCTVSVDGSSPAASEAALAFCLMHHTVLLQKDHLAVHMPPASQSFDILDCCRLLMAQPSVDHKDSGLRCQKLVFDGTVPLEKAAAEEADLDFKKFGF